MSSDNCNPLIVGVSARALFDMREENDIFTTQGEAAYRAYQKKNVLTPMKPGTVFPLIKKLLALNEPGKKPRVELVLITKNDAETGHRVYESIRQYGLEIPRAIMSKGEFNPEVLKAYNIDLFLSRDHDNVVDALKAGIAAAQINGSPSHVSNEKDGVHFAIDGDKVIFSGLSENIYLQHGVDAYLHHERVNKDKPMEGGPFTALLLKLNELKKTYPQDQCPIKISLVTMRSEIRPLNTLQAWGDQYVDTLYLMGRINPLATPLEKAPLLKAIGADIFFDDSRHHTDLSADVLPTGYVPDVEALQVPSLSDIMNMAAGKKNKPPRQKIKSPKKKPAP